MKRGNFIAIAFSIVVLGLGGIYSVNGATGKTGTGKQTAQNGRNAKVTFVELGSVNCIPCKAMQPVMKEIEQEYGDQVSVVFHDVWTEAGRPFAEKYGIRAIPTQVFLDKDGKEFFRHMGYFPAEEIAKVLERQGVKKSGTKEKGQPQ